MSLKNLIKEAETEQYEFKTRLRYRKVNDRIADFVFYLSNEKELKGGKKGLEFETLRGYICTIKAIYHSAGIDLGPVALPKSDKNKAFEKLISYEEIRTVVKSATQRERAIFTTHLSSGMGMSEVRSLKYGDFLRALEKYTETDKYFSVSDLDECLNGIKDPIIPIWKMRRVKTDYPYISFTSPEATRETMLYLMERENGKFPIESKRDVLFATKTTGGMISEREYADLFERSNEIRNEKNCERETKIFSLEQFNAVHEKVISELESKCRIFHEASVQRQVIEEKEKLLSSRKWFSQNEYVFDRKKKMIKLNNFNTDTHSTSVLKTNLSAILITDKFVEQFKKELESIRAKNLQVELKIATSKGSSAHSISLKNLNSSSKGLSFGEVLSEGERRAVSFAAFVAEIIVDFPQMPLVFDDPTNSMDNKYEAEIAKRIIELSKERQVIVFTHRITMSSLLHSIRGGQSFNCQRLMSEPVGLISSDVSFILGGAKSNVKTLIKEAEEIKKLSPKEMPSAKINLAIKIRRLLELMIEDVLFDGIVKRHNLNVGSMRLPRMLGVRDEDFTFVDEMMSRYSSDPHSQSAEAAYAEFDVQDMIDDLKKIKEQIDIIEKNKEDCASSLRVSTQL